MRPLKDSRDPGQLIEFVEALVEMIERTGAGRPDDVVAAARRARRAADDWADPIYWEARGHELAGRLDRANITYREFLEAAVGGRSTRRPLQDARLRSSERPS